MEENTHLKMKDLAPEDQPRERLMALGKKNLSNAELLAILIGSGTTGSSVIELAQRILKDADNNITKLSRIDIAELKKYKGIGDAKAVTILAALELGYRMLGENIDIVVTKIGAPIDLYNFIAPKLMDLQREEFWAIYMNNKNKVLGYEKIASGGLTQTTVDLKLIFKKSLELNATTLAVAHNHPSGSVMPSKEDKLLTEKIANASKALGIRFMDHIIVGVRTDNDSSNKHNMFSFSEHGLL